MTKASKKLTKDDLRQPDEVFQASAAGLRWFQERWLILLLVFFVLFGGGLGVAFYSHSQFEKEARAQAVLAEASSLYQQWSLAEGDARGQLEEDVRVQLDRLEADFPRSQAQALASVYRARLSLASADLAAAVENFGQFRDALPRLEKALALQALGKLHEDREDWDSAISAYDDLLKDSDSQFRGEALLGKARALRMKGQGSEAVSIYESFLREFPASPEVPLVRGYMNLAQNQETP